MDRTLIDTIKFNCDVSDAQYWGYFSVCGLLLRYRDLYRSEQGLKPWADIRRDEIAAWIAAKEARWPEMEQEGFRTLAVGGQRYDPFDVDGINQALEQQGLVYGAGYGMYFKPTFFLAELSSIRTVSGLTVYTSGRELVRDLFSSPGLLREKAVFLRLEPLMVLLLYKHAELNTRSASILADAFAHYGFGHRQIVDDRFEQRLEAMAGRYAEVLLAHEVAEAAEETPEWKDILSLTAGDRQAEHFLRAVKDLVADTSEQGPYRTIIEHRDRGALGLTIALTEGYRRVLFPELKEAHALLAEHGEWNALEEVRKTGYRRFRTLRDDVVGRFLKTGGRRDDFLSAVKDLLRETLPGT